MFEMDVKNIALIINFKNQPDSSIIRKIVKKNIYNKIFVSNNTKLITNKKIQGIYLSSYNNKIFLSNKNHVFKLFKLSIGIFHILFIDFVGNQH